MRESSGITWRLFTYSDDVGWRKKATQSNSKAAILLFILFEFILFYFAMMIKKSTGIYERREKSAVVTRDGLHRNSLCLICFSFPVDV
jgi:hypothetical protein